MNWLVLYTKPKNEVKVAERLAAAGITVYCPLVTTLRQWSDRKKKVTLPLFSSYVFVQLAEVQRAAVFEVPGVVRYLFWLGKPAVVREEEMATLKEMLSDTYKEVRLATLAPGDRLILKEQKGNQTILILNSLGTKLILEK
jgi:transcriptional antiterminator RfaH